MQTNEFEKKVQSKLEGFELLPDAEVWQQVAARIAKEKKRRVFLLFLLLAGFLLLSGSTTWWFINKDNSKQSLAKKDKPNHSVSAENVPVNQPSAGGIKKDNKINALKVKENNKLQNLAQNKSAAVDVNKIQLQKRSKTYDNIPEKINALHEFPFKTSKDKQANASVVKENKSNDKIRFETSRTLLPHKYLQPGNLTIGKIDSTTTTTLVTKEKAGAEKDTSATSSVTKRLPSKKPLSYGFTAYAGVSNNLSGLPLSNAGSSQNYSTSPGSVIGIPNSNIFLALNYKSGFSFGAGVFIVKQLTKKINVSAGVDYHFLTAKSSVGSKVNAQRSFYDSALQHATLVSSYYNSGQGIGFTNTYHKIELPINLLFRINKNQSKPFSIFAGISPTYVIATHGLYANKTTNTYYIEKYQYKHFLLSGQTGFLYTFTTYKNNKLSIGPFVQYDFTNLTKTITGTKQHLFFSGIKVNVILK